MANDNAQLEHSRRDWFEAAQAAEARVEVLEGYLLRLVEYFTEPGMPEDLLVEFKALSASAEPSGGTCLDNQPCGGPDGHCRWCKHPAAPVERDERADFERAALESKATEGASYE